MKKLLSFIIMSALIFTSMPPVYGAESDSKELAAAIGIVKNLVNIEDSFTNFNYSTWEEDMEGIDKTNKLWSLSWSEPKHTKGAYAVVDSNGLLRSFNTFEDGDYSESFGSLSKQEGEEIALSFLKGVLPEEYNDIRFSSYHGYGNVKSYIFDLYINDVMIDFIHMTVGINSDSHEIFEYSSENLSYINTAVFPDSGTVISLDEGKEAYIDKIGVDLVYRIYNDYGQQIAESFMAYTLPSLSWGIDAITGKPIEYNYYSIYGRSEDGLSDYGGGADSGALSPIEEEAVLSVEGLLSQEECQSILRKNVPEFSNIKKFDYASLSRDLFSNQYVWFLSYDWGSGSVDAETGEIVSFSIYTDYSKTTKRVSLEKAKDTAMNMINKLAPEKIKELVFNEYRSNYGDNYEEYHLTFTRHEKNLPVIDNSITVTVTKDKGKVLSYYTNWNENLQFPEEGETISIENAFDIFADNSGFDIAYILVDGKPLLAYVFADSISYQIDPKTGGLIDYSGKAYKEKKVSEYGDIKGKWYEDTVMTLLENGYYLEGEDFNGNKGITQKEFFRYIYSKNNYYMDQEELYDMLEDYGIIKSDEINPDALLLRQDAAKFAVRYLGLGKAGEKYEIYKSVFRDYIEAEYRGYAALARSIGIIQGNSSNRLLPTNATTRAESAVIIFRIINES